MYDCEIGTLVCVLVRRTLISKLLPRWKERSSIIWRQAGGQKKHLAKSKKGLSCCFEKRWCFKAETQSSWERLFQKLSFSRHRAVRAGFWAKLRGFSASNMASARDSPTHSLRCRSCIFFLRVTTSRVRSNFHTSYQPSRILISTHEDNIKSLIKPHCF